MKHLIRLSSTLILLFTSSSLFAQNTSTITSKDSSHSHKMETEKMKTLFSDSKNFKLKSWGLSMSPLVQFGQLGKQRGFNFAFHANNKWAVGIAHIRSTGNGHEQMNYAGFTDKPETAFTALSLEYTVQSNSILHVSFPLMIGSIVTRDRDFLIQPAYKNQYDPQMDYRWEHYNHYEGSKSLGIQAGINLELNVFKYVKLFTGVNYRFAAGKNSTSDMEGISGTVGLKLGLFDQKMGKKKK